VTLITIRSIAAAVILAPALLAVPQLVRAEPRYTEKQIEQFTSYVGKTYWITPEKNQQPAIFSAPSADAKTFQPAPKESFELKEIVEKASDKPYYRAAFESGKEGFIPVTAFLQELQSAFMTVDPDRSDKAKSAKATEQEQKRRDWIRSQKWPEHVKEAALRGQPAIGMNKKESEQVLGKPRNVVRLKSSNELMGRQEQWIYDKGPVLTFSNGVVVKIQ
jgi:hypothetical protein